jgi:hypothetical protein
MAELSGAEQVISEHLEKLGATLTKLRFTGDSSYPTEYRIEYRGHLIVQPTLDLALVGLIEHLVNRP